MRYTDDSYVVDEYLLNKEIDYLVKSNKVYRHIFYYDLNPLKQFSPSTWLGGELLYIFGYEDCDEDQLRHIDSVVLERLVEICCEYSSFNAILNDPTLFINSITGYIDSSYFITNAFKDIKEHELELVIRYLGTFRKYLKLLLNNTIDIDKNMMYYLNNDVLDGYYTVKSVDYNEVMFALVVDVFHTTPKATPWLR